MQRQKVPLLSGWQIQSDWKLYSMLGTGTGPKISSKLLTVSYGIADWQESGCSQGLFFPILHPTPSYLLPHCSLHPTLSHPITDPWPIFHVKGREGWFPDLGSALPLRIAWVLELVFAQLLESTDFLWGHTSPSFCSPPPDVLDQRQPQGLETLVFYSGHS